MQKKKTEIPEKHTDDNRSTLIEMITEKARFLRLNTLALNNRTLHAGAALSSADIIATLFYQILRLDPQNPQWEQRDIFINSRGHACEPLYVAMADLGFFDWQDLEKIEDEGCHLHGLTATTTPGIEFSTGSLGSALSLAVGAALAQRIFKREGQVYIVTGDGELQEGLLWEAAMSAGHYQLNNLIVIVDRNGYQIDDRGTEEVMGLEPLEDKFAAFHFAVQRINGHDIGQLLTAIETAQNETTKPSVIIAETIKGKGVSFFESGHVHCGRFGRDIDVELYHKAIGELQG
jgi:transketolase